LQHLTLQHRQLSMSSTGWQHCLQQQLFSQQAFSQQPHFSQQAGAQQAFSQQPHFSQQAGAQQAFTGQQGSGQHAFAQQPVLQLLQQQSHSNRSLIPQNRSRTGVGRQQQVFSQHAFSQQAGAQQAFSQQAGAQQAFTGQQGSGQHAFSQQALAQHALHSPQPPQLFIPNRRSRSSRPNPWLHRATLTRSAPKIVLLFIEQ
jgi:hypothetical protein